MNTNKQKKTIGTHVVLMSKLGKMQSLWLPEPPEGKYKFECTSGSKDIHDLYFEARRGKWFVCSSKCDFFKNRFGEICSAIEIFDKCIFSLNQVEHTDVIYAESLFETSGVFHNYFVDSLAEINIGRSNKNDIVYPNPLVSHAHAILRRNKHTWSIEDLNSTNGVFVNGSRVTKTELHLGDNIYIMGLRIIIGIGFISINDGNDRILIASKDLHRSQPIAMHELPEHISDDSEEKELFNRLPRKRKALNANPIVIEAPPISLNSNNIPLLLRMGSPMIMSSASLLAGNITSMLSSVLFPVLTQKYTEKQRKEYEERRNTKYIEYLQKKRQEIQREKENELEVLEHNYPDLNRLISFTDTKDRLWERRTVDDDFMSLRIGSGNYPMLARCEAPPRGFEIDEDPLMEKMYALAETPVMLDYAPIMTSFVEDDVCGILGEREIAIEFVRRLIVQLTLLHSYDEVKIVFLADQQELSQLEFIKYIPHIWNDQRDFRFLATDTSSGYQISEYLKQEVDTDLKKQRELKDILKERPYYIVFALNKRIFDSMEVLKDIMQTERNCGISVVAVFDDLPKECTKVFDLKASGEHSVISLKQIEKEDEHFRLDYMDSTRALKSMKEISNTSLKVITQAYSLPKTVTFLEMFGVGRVEYLNPLKRWKDNNPVKSLATPVGVATDGSLFMLDLHEKFQGPHGLVAGMTGSGKSEFLITYILSMAVNYHPDEVAFVLIDYKGGGLADAFDNPEKGIHLPHLVGTITNLDGASIQRSLRSLHSEVLRRQQEFKKAKAITEEATMDIYKYQKLYRSGQIDRPMPHLFIISDEFAELKQQKPEFMDNLISIARIGRSLGVHLILATQKPSGVVNDQIRSNTKFRVCLKVQEKADSQDMLKRPEAAELKDTGRFYLQVGYNEFFALGQSAWTGADYEPQDEVIVHKDDSIQFMDDLGQTVHGAKKRVKKITDGKAQLEVVVKLLSDTASSSGIMCNALWAPELDTDILLAQIQEQTPVSSSGILKIPIGMVDDPENQRQFPLIYDLQRSKNLLIVGEKGTGKTTIVQSMLYQLAMTYTPEQVQFYILDYSSRMLKLFRDLPHCGAVLFEDDTDRLSAFFETINQLIAERKKLFFSMDVDNYEAATAIKPMPLIMVVIDGFSVLGTSKIGHSHLSNFKEYLKNGTSYGIKYVLTANAMSEIHAQIRLELGDRLALRVKDKYEYVGILNLKVDNIPPDLPGRGLCAVDGKVLEFQSASIYGFSKQGNITQKLKAEMEVCAAKYSKCSGAQRLPVTKNDVTYEEFSSQFRSERIPLGFSLQTSNPVALPLKQLTAMSVYFGKQEGVVPIFSNLLYAAKRNQMEVFIIPRRGKSCFCGNCEEAVSLELYDGADLIPPETAKLTAFWKQLMKEIAVRKNILEEYCTEHSLQTDQEDIVNLSYRYMMDHTSPVMILIENMADFSSNLDANTALVYNRIFEVCHKLNIRVIAGYEPDDHQIGEQTIVYSGFNTEGTVMLFGGRFDGQKIMTLPGQTDEKLQFNRCIIRHRNKLQALVMPCGILAEESLVDEDEKDIF